MSTRFPYSPAKTPPAPAAIIRLSRPDGTAVIADLPAHLDTAADMTVVPLPLIQRLGVPATGSVIVRGFGGITTTVDLFEVQIEIPGVTTVTCEVCAPPRQPVLLLGRDILNQFRITLDGPNQVVEFH